MTLAAVLAGAAILTLSIGDAAAVGRSAFDRAVEAYATYVIPRCGGEMVNDYLRARTERDRQFVKSLGKLLPEYNAAVTRSRTRDQQIVYHCSGPPPPPGAAPPDQREVVQQKEADRRGYAAEADGLFESMADARRLLSHERGD